MEEVNRPVIDDEEYRQKISNLQVAYLSKKSYLVLAGYCRVSVILQNNKAGITQTMPHTSN